jgi:hypothetical protein
MAGDLSVTWVAVESDKHKNAGIRRSSEPATMDSLKFTSILNPDPRKQ